MGLLNSFSFNMKLFEKYFFYLFSFYLLVRGLCMLCWALNLYHQALSFLNTWSKGIVISIETLIAIGGVVIAFAICAGAYSLMFFDNAKFRNRDCHVFCTTVFAILFWIILIVQSIAAIYLIVLMSEVVDDFKGAFINYHYPRNGMFVDDVQDKLYCCGMYSYHDYEQILKIPVPGSCCYNSGDTCTDVIRPGCVYMLYNQLAYTIYKIGIFVASVTVAEIIGFVIAVNLTKSIKKKNTMKGQDQTQIHIISCGHNAGKIFPSHSNAPY